MQLYNSKFVVGASKGTSNLVVIWKIPVSLMGFLWVSFYTGDKGVLVKTGKDNWNMYFQCCDDPARS